MSGADRRRAMANSFPFLKATTLDKNHALNATIGGTTRPPLNRAIA
jgi:hypothetical protein